MTLPYDYYPKVLSAIELLSEGRTKTMACDEADITLAVFDSYVKQNPQLQELYAEAEQRSYDALADALVNIDNHAIHGQSDSKMASVISKNIMWVLEKRDSKRFGQRLVVNHNVTVDKAIIDALQAGKRRAAITVESTEYIDVTPEMTEEEEIAALCAY